MVGLLICTTCLAAFQGKVETCCSYFSRQLQVDEICSWLPHDMMTDKGQQATLIDELDVVFEVFGCL